MARGFERPPLWAGIVMIIGVAALVAGFVVEGHRAPSAVAAGPEVGTPLVSETTGGSAARTKVLVIGDSYTGGSAQGGYGNAGWARIVATKANTDGYSVSMTISAAGGGGYTAAGPADQTFVDLARKATGNYDLIILFGSRNDVAGRQAVQTAASQALATLRQSSPKAKLLVIGPAWINGNPPSNILADRDAIQAAAQQAGGDFLDPVAQDWFGGQFTSLIGADGVHPTDAGHRHMADLIAPTFEKDLAALQQAAPSTAVGAATATPSR